MIFKRKYKTGKKEVKISKIKLKDGFVDTVPGVPRFIEKYRIFKQWGGKSLMGFNPIVVSEDLTLQDGYVTYLILKMFDYKKVDVTVE